MYPSVSLAFRPICYLLCFCLAIADLHGQESRSNEVVVVANINSPESLELANYYIHQRNIPRENLIIVQTTTEESISRSAFVNELLNPIRRELIKRGLIQGEINPDKTDHHGRYHFYAYQVNFRYLVTCLGIPLKIQNQLLSEPDAPKNIAPIFRKTYASVDSDLSLLTAPDSYYIGWQPNPLFEVKKPSRLDYTAAISVCRLDGPSLKDAKNLIDSALHAEGQLMLYGRAYIDLHNKHKDGNLWLRKAASQLRDYGYDVDVIPDTHHWSLQDRFEAPAIYFGWYQGHASGPLVSGHPLPKGSIAAHIHSYSAATIRATDRGWVGPLIHSGVAVTFGNVYEPYLQLTMRPDRFIESLLNGNCVGDASIYAQTTLSWQNVTIGDPLFTPFASTVSWDPEKLIRDLKADPYEKIVALNRIDQQNRDRAVELAINSQTLSPNLPLAYKIITDYSEQVSPNLLNLLYDYLASVVEIDEVYAYLYIKVLEKLWEVEDFERYRKLVKLLESSSSNWNLKLQQQLLKSINNQEELLLTDQTD